MTCCINHPAGGRPSRFSWENLARASVFSSVQHGQFELWTQDLNVQPYFQLHLWAGCACPAAVPSLVQTSCWFHAYFTETLSCLTASTKKTHFQPGTFCVSSPVSKCLTLLGCAYPESGVSMLMEKCFQSTHQRRVTQPADCCEGHIRFIPKPQRPFQLPGTSGVKEHLTSLATALLKQLKRKVHKLKLFKSWPFTCFVVRPMRDLPLWWMWKGCTDRSSVYYSQSSPNGPTAQVSVLSKAFVTICTACT